MKILLKSLLIFSCLSASAQSNWDVAKIPEELKKNSNIVIRNEELFFDIKSLNSAQYNYKITATILNKAGDYFSEMDEVYDKFSSIYNIKATLYDASGKKVKEYKSSDIKDQSLTSNSSILEDNRVKILKFQSNTYPYTIEYSFSQDFKGLLYFPQWRDFKGFNSSVENTSYTIQKRSDYNMKFKTSLGLKTDSVTVGDKKQYKWTSSNVKAIDYEPLYAGIDNISSWVKASPNLFEYDGSSGNFDTWKNFGSWMYKLNEGGNKLPDLFKEKIQQLIKNAKSETEKISILYNYLQQNTRYVSVQLGIGGFKPILAEKVASVNYGDCKALSNFMKAMLNEVGIQSNLIVIGNGKPSLDANYSSIGQANHMILVVPSAKDNLFLECTSQHLPMGFIGYSNSNRTVLMVTEDGGKLIKTPEYKANDNYQIRKTDITFNTEDEALVKIKTTYGNAQFEDNLGFMLLEPIEQKKKLLENSRIPITELISFKCEQADKNKAEMVEDITLKSNQILSKGGSKIFLQINQVNKKERVPIKIENRKTDFAIDFAYLDNDVINYKLPTGYKVEFIPKDVEITSEFGTYSAKFTTKEDTIVYTRVQNMNGKKYPAEKYNEYVDFYKKIVTADNVKAIITKSL